MCSRYLNRLYLKSCSEFIIYRINRKLKWIFETMRNIVFLFVSLELYVAIKCHIVLWYQDIDRNTQEKFYLIGIQKRFILIHDSNLVIDIENIHDILFFWERETFENGTKRYINLKSSLKANSKLTLKYNVIL